MSGKFLKGLAAEWMKFQPEVEECNHLYAEGLRAVFYTGWKKTKVFAWIGLPEGASREHPVPGMVLVHGGGGTAFAHWVKYWNSLGYAAICMDNCGAMQTQDLAIDAPASGWPHHQWSGAPGWGAFDQGALPPEDQWFTHAASAVIFGHNILRSMPEVQTDRIGMTGISWGGVLTVIVAGLDPRFKAVAPVYGAGFLYQDSSMTQERSVDQLSAAQYSWWVNEWDPSNFAGNIQMPSLWFNGTDDFHFRPKQWNRTTNLPKGSVCRSMQIRWPHGHGYVGEEMPELRAFFAEELKGEGHFIRVGEAVVSEDGTTISAPFTNGKPYAATLIVAAGKHHDRHTLPAQVNEDGTLSARLPAEWEFAYLSALTEDLTESTSSFCFQ